MCVKVILKNGKEVKNTVQCRCNNFRIDIESLRRHFGNKKWMEIGDSVYPVDEVEAIVWEDD